MLKQGFIPLVIGLLVGIMLTFMYSQYEEIYKRTVVKPVYYGEREYSVGGNSFFLQLRDTSNITLPVVDNDLTKLVTTFPFDPLLNASILENKVRVLCYIMSSKASQQAALAVIVNLSKHCNKAILFGKYTDKKIGAIDIGLKVDKKEAWNNYKLATEYVFNHYASQFDLFIKLEYDTFIVPENIRFMSLLHQAYIPGYMGHVLTDDKPRGVMITLDKEGLEILHRAIPSCPPRHGGISEELELESCFTPLHILPIKESKDFEGKPRFQMLVPSHNLPGNTISFNPWYMKYIHHPQEMGSECCSDYSISFHYVQPNQMYLLEFMVYHMRPFGVGFYTCPADVRSVIGLPEVAPSIAVQSSQVGLAQKL